MSRFINQRDMSALEVYRCCSEARAILNLCHAAAWTIQNTDSQHAIKQLADDIGEATRLASELLDQVSDAIERHEGGAVHAAGGAT